MRCARGTSTLPYRGVDNDARKIAQAQRAARAPDLHDVTFERRSISRAGMPAHSGSVAMLDVLQFVPPEAQDAILDAAIARTRTEARRS